MVAGGAYSEPSERTSGQPVPQSDWRLPVPAGTTIHEFEPTSSAVRSRQRITVVPDLVIKERGDDLHYVFGSRAPSVEVDTDGNIYIAEPMPRTGRVLVFDADGEFVRMIGRSGQGPGEYLQPFAVEWAGDALFVFDPGQSRLTRWNAAGELLGGQRSDALRTFRSIRGLADGSLVGTRRINLPDGDFDTGFLAVLRVDPDINEQVQFVRAPYPPRIIDPGFGEIARTEPNAFYAGATPPGVAVAADGSVYVSTLDEYQVLAYEPDGTVRWALRAASPRQPLDDGEVDWLMEHHNVRFPQRRRSAIEWPDRQYALGDIKVDAHGRLYVFPYVPRGSDLDERPVDVYSPDGEQLFSGVMSGPMANLSWQTPPANGPMLARAWQAVAGDFIYGIAIGRGTDEWQVVRHRLSWPD
jgi:outer membrane protein assembly factor BamB